MAAEGLTVLPVMDRESRCVSGKITLRDLLKGRSKAVVRENERVRLGDHFKTNELLAASIK